MPPLHISKTFKEVKAIDTNPAIEVKPLPQLWHCHHQTIHKISTYSGPADANYAPHFYPTHLQGCDPEIHNNLVQEIATETVQN